MAFKRLVYEADPRWPVVKVFRQKTYSKGCNFYRVDADGKVWLLKRYLHGSDHLMRHTTLEGLLNNGDMKEVLPKEMQVRKGL